jgi:hypothetical protein
MSQIAESAKNRRHFTHTNVILTIGAAELKPIRSISRGICIAPDRHHTILV